MKNPYRTLGLSPGASEDEIRRAYRLLVFREVQRAYEILSYPVNRASRVSAQQSEMDRILKRLKASLASASGDWKFGVSLGKSCLRERMTRCEKPFSPTSGFVRPTPPLPPKAPRRPVSPVPL